MSGTIHRLVTQFFHLHDALEVPDVPQHGIPDGYMDKIPPPEERSYARDPRTQPFIETRQPQDHAA